MSIELKNFASLVGQTIRSHSVQFYWFFEWHQVQKHQVFLGVLIILKTMLPGRAPQFVHILFSFYGLLHGIKSKNINCF